VSQGSNCDQSDENSGHVVFRLLRKSPDTFCIAILDWYRTVYRFLVQWK
jgi:hypothetical protein